MNMDVLSFREATIPQKQSRYKSKAITGIESSTDASIYAKTIINDRPYIIVMEPFLRKCADSAGYIYEREGFWYLTAKELYENFLAVNKGLCKCVVLIDVYYVYDACQPICVTVSETETAVKWQSSSHYHSPDWRYFGELPAFHFDKRQYEEALKQLQIIADAMEKR